MKLTETKTEKKAYVSPTITILGDIETITLSFLNGDHLDAAYEQGRPLSDGLLS